MAQVGPTSLTTLFVVSVTVMAFFTTSAASRIEEMAAPNRQIIATMTLIMSYFLLLILAAGLIGHEEVAERPALFGGMKIVFAAFVPPGLVLLYDSFDIVYDAYDHPDFRWRWTGLGLFTLAMIYLGIINIARTPI